jgi:hypothetical protein
MHFPCIVHSATGKRHGIVYTITSQFRATILSTLDIIVSHSNDHALALDAIEHARVVHRHILFGYDLDDLLRHHTTSQCSNIVQFSSTSSSPIDMLASSSCWVGVVWTHSSLINSLICVLIVAYSSSSMEALAPLTRSSAILKAMPVSFSASTSGFFSPAIPGAPPNPSFSCVAANSSQARKAMYRGTSESGNVRV